MTGEVVGTTPVSNMTGVPLFVSAALASCTTLARQQALKDTLLPLMFRLKDGNEQVVVDAVCDVMGRGWRPSRVWRERLLSIGRADLASW